MSVESHINHYPPHDVELEAFVLGTILSIKDELVKVIDILSPDTFYKEEHRIIFTHVITLFKQGIFADIINIHQECRKKSPQITAKFISELTNNIYTSSDTEYKARLLAEYAIRRTMITETQEVVKRSYDLGFDVFDTLEFYETKINETVSFYTKSGIKSAKDLTRDALIELENQKNKPEGISGVPSGFRDLDRITSGWQNSDMIVVAARPGMGKTAFILSMARNIAVDFNMPIAIFSLEMSALQLIKRMISVQTEVNSSSFRSGKLSDGELYQVHERINPLIDAPIYFDDSAGLTILDLKTKAVRMKKQFGIKMIMIDYIQLMSSGNINSGNREQEISSISRAIKMLAKELEIPIIALSQLSRSVESRGGDKKPILSDLRESGAIEQDADIVCFLYRPEYYGIIVNESGESTIGSAEVIIAKHRNGSLESAHLKYISQYTKFDNKNNLYTPSEPLNQNHEFDQSNNSTSLSDELPF